MEISSTITETEPQKFALPVDSEQRRLSFICSRRLHRTCERFTSPGSHSFPVLYPLLLLHHPLLPIIRDNLNLTATDIGNAGVASVSGGAVFAPDCHGNLLVTYSDHVVHQHPSSSSLRLLFTSPPSPPRPFPSFSSRLGNLGGGATQLIMPLVFSLIRDIGAVKFTAWRIAFFIPALFQTLSAFAILIFGQDLPDGNYQRLQNSGNKQKDKFSRVFYHGITNYRGWILALTYGYCFGVELTVDNIIAEYFYDRFNLKLHTAGIIAASFGLANIVSRTTAGVVLSDMMAKRFGMRGRLWALWASLFKRLVVLHLEWFPFVSRRSLGVISGMTGGGGNVVAVLTQLIFFKGSKYSKETGITLMGIMIIATEEDYYLSEWSSKEQGKGLHQASLKFADNSRSERGRRVHSQTLPSNATPSANV
ncbi:hypothetical protein CXB51_032334 [Gossypium anomalum]|uniref:Uncharacterized protein n=1 Tax=Gossypium anomalum TaxID=47600 RepID=A0A8J5XUF2_9ROSI|nr:hypothetical protein CXB51_032334 [Gossypium anomalum]